MRITATRERILVLTLACALVAMLAACVHDTNVRGPDGERAHSITCSNPDQCYRRAAELCAGGYVIRTSGGTVTGTSYKGTGSISSSTNLLVSCKSDLLDEPSPPAAEKPEDERMCELAHRQASDFADYFASLSAHGKRLDELPTRRAFVAVCRKLPENVQSCLHDKYREEHRKACDAVLTRLEARDRDRIDGLFFEATGSGDAGTP